MMRGGYDIEVVEHITLIGLIGAPDPVIFARARSAMAIIVTFDEDFAHRRNDPPGSHFGAIRFRIEPTTIEHTVETLNRVFAEFAPKTLFGS